MDSIRAPGVQSSGEEPDQLRAIHFPPGELVAVFSLGGRGTGNVFIFWLNFSGNILCAGQPDPAVAIRKEPFNEVPLCYPDKLDRSRCYDTWKGLDQRQAL